MFAINLRRLRSPVCTTKENGQALVELALTLPLLFLILVGVSEFAILAYAAIEVSNAAKAGAQYASYSHGYAAATNLANIQAAAAADAHDITLGTTSATVAYLCSDGSTPVVSASGLTDTCTTGNAEPYVTVTTQTTIDPHIHVPGLPTTFTLRGKAVQKVSDQ